MQQVDSNILKLFCNFDVNGLDNLVFGWTGERGCCGGSPSSWSEGFGVFISIPDSLVMEAQSNRGAIWAQIAEEALQYLSEVSKVGMFVGLKQPTNLRDERGLDRMGVNFVVRVRQLKMEALEEVIHCGVKPNQNADIHGAIQGQGAEVLKVLAHCHEGLA